MKTALSPVSFAGLMLLFVCGNAYADDFRARIVKVQGDVVIVNDKGEERKPEKSQFLVNKMETVVTRDGGKAVVQFDDGALSVMDEKSSIRVEQSGWFSQLGGKVYYVFRKILGEKEQPKQVKTGFATIGIRGTTFIVYDTAEGKGVALQDGKLNIESPGEDYAITRQKQTDDFEAFKQEMRQREETMQREFKEYKEKTEREFVEYKKSFDLESNRMVSFDGNKVSEVELDESFKNQFNQMESFAGKYVRAYRELDTSTQE